MGLLLSRMRTAIVLGSSTSLLFLGSCSKPTISTPATDDVQTQWVVGWGAPPENANASGANSGSNEQTYRMILLPTIDGTQERVHFSNLYGTAPLTIGAARIAVVTTAPAVDISTDTALTFAGSTSVTLAAGQTATSDPVNVTYSYGQKLAVTLYVKGALRSLTAHASEPTVNYVTAAGAGNTTSDAAGSSFVNSLQEWFLVTGMDVYGPYEGTVVLYGSSSIDGHGSNYSSVNAYPAANTPIPGQDNDRPSDWLARSLIASGRRIGVMNGGQIGDPAGEDATTAAGNSQAGVDRFQRDVVNQSGIKAVVVYLGGIDLRSDCVPATQVEASLSNIVAQGAAAHIRVILATLPPAEYCMRSDPSLLPSAANPWQGDMNPGPENPGSTQRRALNAWIRTTGASLPGVVAVADFDAALAYPAHPDFMMPNFTSSDNFHPNGLGYQTQNGAIPISALLGQ